VKQQADARGFADEYRDSVPVSDAPLGALIGRIGEREPFYVGDHLEFSASADGPLFLGINDQWLNDNTGELFVVVNVKVK
jgi:hypothetical protein